MNDPDKPVFTHEQLLATALSEWRDGYDTGVVVGLLAGLFLAGLGVLAWLLIYQP